MTLVFLYVLYCHLLFRAIKCGGCVLRSTRPQVPTEWLLYATHSCLSSEYT